MKSCIACGMPLEGEHEKDIGMETPDGTVCAFDIADGAVKDGPSVFAGGVAFFLTVTDNDRALAERLTRLNMSRLPYWIARPFAELDGETASDAEWAACMAKLQ